MTAKEYLQQARTLDVVIAAKLEQAARWEAVLTRGTSRLTGMPGGGKSDWTNTADSLIQLRTSLEAEIGRLLALRREVVYRIGLVGDARYRAILELRYINGWDWRRIAAKLGYTRESVCRLHGKALRAVRVPEE